MYNTKLSPGPRLFMCAVCAAIGRRRYCIFEMVPAVQGERISGTSAADLTFRQAGAKLTLCWIDEISGKLGALITLWDKRFLCSRFGVDRG
jgi:hypothetical protein